MGHVVQNDIRQRRILVHVWDPVMDDCHGDGRQPGDEQSVYNGNAELPPLGWRIACYVGLDPMEAVRGTAGQSCQPPSGLPSAARLVRAGEVESVGPLVWGVVSLGPGPRAEWGEGETRVETVLCLGIRIDEVELESCYVVDQLLDVAHNLQL